MLVGYFVAFVAIGVLAIVASVAASAAGRGGRDDRRGGGGGGGGFGGMFLAMQLLDFILRMWFWSSILGANMHSASRGKGRAFYKSVFGFVFGDGNPNQGWEEKERKTHHLLHPGQQGRDHAGGAHGDDGQGER